KTVKNSDRELLYFNSESIIPSIDRELSGEMKIMSIEPKDIKLIFSKKQSKKVFVVPNISYSINKNYLINTVKVIPNTILITGPSFIVDTIDTVFTQKQNISDLSSNLKANLLLQKVEFCNYNRDFVAVAINIEKKTEKTIAVPVESLFPSSLKNSTFVPNLINLKFSVGIHQFSKIDASQFQLTVERINSSSINSDIYRVKAIRIPSKIYNLQITPNIVTILKK
ncbi:MAG TPA: hypothetical protein PKG63_07020, partial [Bacteroidales bacterium]|nr:hypothetical protein [Bacteroidales bacterium]